MKVILGITQLTTDGTKQTASSARELTALADGLKNSVAGFKLAAKDSDGLTMADTTLLSWINAEVDHALTLVQESIAKFSAAPENAAVLRLCPEHLHQVSGALRMVGLTGATRLCEAIEGSFAGLGAARPDARRRSGSSTARWSR